MGPPLGPFIMLPSQGPVVLEGHPVIPQSRGIFGTISAPYRHETPLGLRMHHKTHGGERIAITPLIGPLTDIRLNITHGIEASCRRGERFEIGRAHV